MLLQTESENLSNTNCYSHRTALSIVSIITVIITSLFPIASIIILSKIARQKVRLGVVSVFTFGFALALGLSGAKKSDIYAASIASVLFFVPLFRGIMLMATGFAAVHVVFFAGENCCDPLTSRHMVKSTRLGDMSYPAIQDILNAISIWDLILVKTGKGVKVA